VEAAFGLYGMHGNVLPWVEDCVHGNYNGAPEDGSAWTEGGYCNGRVVRGGSWSNDPSHLRSAYRGWSTTDDRGNALGFRVGRTLTP
jgi:formylglycine-generating enzyme required for sulfatase activity